MLFYIYIIVSDNYLAIDNVQFFFTSVATFSFWTVLLSFSERSVCVDFARGASVGVSFPRSTWRQNVDVIY